MSETNTLPVLPLRDIVVFPHMIVPLFVGREKSVRALEDVMADDKQILLVAQNAALVNYSNTVDAVGNAAGEFGALALQGSSQLIRTVRPAFHNAIRRAL